MLAPALTDEAFLRQVTEKRSQGEHLHLWWLGQSGFVLQWKGRHLLLDPYLSDSLTRKYAQTDKPHVRMTARVIAPERLDFIDVVTSTHNHTDHLDAETLLPLLQANPQLAIVVPAANRAFAADRLRLSPERLLVLDAGESLRISGFELHAIPAAHEGLDRDDQGRYLYVGYVIKAGPWTIYHSGDTVLYPDLGQWLSRWSLDLVLLPINGRNPERRVAGNLNAAEAARLAKDLRARMVIPCHYDMFEFNTADPAEFAHEAEALGQPYRVLRNGEHWSTDELPKLERAAS